MPMSRASVLPIVACWVLARSALAAGPARVISLAPSVTEIVYALGLGDRLVGVSAQCDFPPQASTVDRVGTFVTPNIEAIVAKRPDLVIAVPSPGNRSPVEVLQRLGLRVLVVNPSTVAEIAETILVIARALGDEAAGRAVVGGMQARMAAVEQRVAGAPAPRVLLVVGQTPLIAAGAGTVQDELIRMAGGINVAAVAGASWPRLSIEAMVVGAPDVIIDTTMGSEGAGGTEAVLRFWQRFPGLPAVRTGRVHRYAADPLLRPGPRIPDALESLARFMHPERFSRGLEPSSDRRTSVAVSSDSRKAMTRAARVSFVAPGQ
jgi:iron complex transport system substrate-binding protein